VRSLCLAHKITDRLIAPAHIAQILTYLRMSRLPVGLLMNFHERRLIDGVSRYAI
jgi:GxxExxY protein